MTHTQDCVRAIIDTLGDATLCLLSCLDRVGVDWPALEAEPFVQCWDSLPVVYFFNFDLELEFGVTAAGQLCFEAQGETRYVSEDAFIAQLRLWAQCYRL